MLISLVVAGLALALTWWLVAGRTPAPAETTGAGQDLVSAGPAQEADQPGATGTDGEATGPGDESTGADDEGTGAGDETSGPAGEATEPATSAASPDRPAQDAEPVPERQARRMEALLSSSSSSRGDLSGAIESATRCEQAGVRAIRDITASRRDQLADAKALDVTELPSGGTLKDALVDALDASHAADAAFLSWARRHVNGGCTATPGTDRDYRLGLTRSETAQQAKIRFSKAWRPIAEKYDLTAWSPDQI